MTLFLEGNIWVWKCLFMLESKYKHITCTHWCTHVHTGRQSRVCMYSNENFSPNTKNIHTNRCWWVLFVFTYAGMRWLRGLMFLCMIYKHISDLKSGHVLNWVRHGRDSYMFLSHTCNILTRGESVNWFTCWLLVCHWHLELCAHVDKWNPTWQKR